MEPCGKPCLIFFYFIYWSIWTQFGHLNSLKTKGFYKINKKLKILLFCKKILNGLL